jgi:hypothetical protein
MFEEVGYRDADRRLRHVRRHAWITTSATEVDFLLRRGPEYLAIEIDARARHENPPMIGLRAIAGRPRLVRRVFVYERDRPPRTADGVDVWPLAD